MVRWAVRVRREAIIALRRLFPQETRRADSILLGVILLIAVAVRLVFVNQPIRYDEAFTVIEFAGHEFTNCFDYPVPNNHVLHTLLLHPVVKVFGTDYWVVRIPALLSGLLSIPLIYVLTRRIGGGQAGSVLAASALAVWPVVVLYDTMARGYSLLNSLGLLLVLLMHMTAAGRVTWLCIIGIALTTALGLLAVPSFLFLVTGAWMWWALLLLNSQNRSWQATVRTVSLSGLIMVVLTALFYLPVIIVNGGIDALTGNRFVRALEWGVFIDGLASSLWLSALSLCRDVPQVVMWGLVALAAFTYWHAVRVRRWALPSLLLCLIAGSLVVLISKRALPFERSWLCMVPICLAIIGAGLGFLRPRWEKAVTGVSLGGAVLSAVILIQSNRVRQYSDTGTFPAAQAVAAFLAEQMNPADQIDLVLPVDLPLEYELRRNGMFERIVKATGSPTQCFVIVKPSEYDLADLGYTTAGRLVARFEDAEVYAFPPQNFSPP